MAENPEARETSPVAEGERRGACLPILPSCRGYVSICRGRDACAALMALLREPGEEDGLDAVRPRPTFAVVVEPLPFGAGRGLRAFTGCAAAGLLDDGVEAALLAPCLDCFGLEALAQLYRSGVRELVIARPPCRTACSRDASLLAARVCSFNGLLSPGGMDRLQLVELSSGEWLRRRAAAGAAGKAIAEGSVQPAPLDVWTLGEQTNERTSENAARRADGSSFASPDQGGSSSSRPGLNRGALAGVRNVSVA